MKGGKDAGGYAWKGGKVGVGGKDGTAGKGGKFGKGEKGAPPQQQLLPPPPGAGKQGLKGSGKESAKGGGKGGKGGKGYGGGGWTHDAPAAPAAAPAPTPPAAPPAAAKAVWPAWTRDLPSDHQPSHAPQQPSPTPAYRPQASCRTEPPRPAASAPSTAFWPEWSSDAPAATPVESYGRPLATHHAGGSVHSRDSYGLDWTQPRGAFRGTSAPASAAEDSWGEEPAAAAAQQSHSAASSDDVWAAAGGEAFRTGEKVSARYTDNKWYPARIAARDSEWKTYSVTWEFDGSTTADLPEYRLRKIAAAAQTPAVDDWEPVVPTAAADDDWSAPASASVKSVSEPAVEEPTLKTASSVLAFHASEKVSAQY
eukprot:Rhum_TRINITY_DN13838_c0_g1::Rhum_TRINITY_DN13838_c0_g1_i6::g.64431::m.64431